MNKTLSVNIGGIVFHIEEQAFDRLNRYLDAIKGYFTASDGRDEIIQDIESRIAEMFQERVTNGKQVILESDVEQVMNVMGRPEQFANTEEAEIPNSQQQHSNSERRANRRLFRDPDDRVVGGVCSGLSHYMGIDPFYLRLIFGIAFFVYGSGFLLYLILMIIMPKAISTSDKLEMKGEPVNISNISRSISSDVSGRGETAIARFFDALGQLITGGFKVLGKIFAAFFIVVGILILIAFLLVFLALLGVGGISIPFVVTDLFMSPWQQTMAMLGGFFLLGIPMIMLIFKAIRILFKIKMDSKIINWTALALWIIGVVLSIYVVSSVATEFRSVETQRIDIPIVQPVNDTLSLDILDPRDTKNDWYYVNNHRLNDPFDVTTFVDSLRIESVTLDIIKSQSPTFELVQINSARGIDRRDALDNARKVQYSIQQENSKMKFDETFFLPKGVKYRRQKIQLLLKVPVGKSVYLSDNMNQIIYDIRNVTNTYDGDMLGKVWTMTPDGLECVGCNLPGSNSRNKHKDVHIRINGKGVNVNSDGDDEDSSFNVDSKDVDIKINENGVQIDTKKK